MEKFHSLNRFTKRNETQNTKKKTSLLRRVYMLLFKKHTERNNNTSYTSSLSDLQRTSDGKQNDPKSTIPIFSSSASSSSATYKSAHSPHLFEASKKVSSGRASDSGLDSSEEFPTTYMQIEEKTDTNSSTIDKTFSQSQSEEPDTINNEASKYSVKTCSLSSSLLTRKPQINQQVIQENRVFSESLISQNENSIIIETHISSLKHEVKSSNQKISDSASRDSAHIVLKSATLSILKILKDSPSNKESGQRLIEKLSELHEAFLDILVGQEMQSTSKEPGIQERVELAMNSFNLIQIELEQALDVEPKLKIYLEQLQIEAGKEMEKWVESIPSGIIEEFHPISDTQCSKPNLERREKCESEEHDKMIREMQHEASFPITQWVKKDKECFDALANAIKRASIKFYKRIYYVDKSTKTFVEDYISFKK